uniref:Uncharacterized protein n=1 Tax=Wuchereria bancrofti TaxID=6293 RepID=A0AAF5Q5D7_WUCBA
MDYVAPMVNKIGIHIEGALMYELQERKVKANREYLKAFRLLNSICQDMANKIQSNKAKTQDLLARTAALQNENSEMEEMANKLEETYEMLYHPVQPYQYLGGCRLLNVEFLELKGFLVQSTASLQDREVLFKYALDATLLLEGIM